MIDLVRFEEERPGLGEGRRDRARCLRAGPSPPASETAKSPVTFEGCERRDLKTPPREMARESVEDSRDVVSGTTSEQEGPKFSEARRLDAGLDASDAVERALADALSKATAVGEWSVVAQLARELEGRRAARARAVNLDAERRSRGRR